MSKSVTRQGINDTVPYLYSREEADKILEGYAPHERAARGHGVPKLGSGLVFPVNEDDIICTPFRAPPHFRRLIGLDFGTDHPFAAVGIIYDVDSDVIYVARTFKQSDALISTHVAAIRPWGDWIPVAWPHDGNQRREIDKGCKALAELYRDAGLTTMMSNHATHEAGGYAVEPTIREMLERMNTGRFKVFSTEEEWLSEFRMYHRKEGQIVKLNDDLMSATRIAVMMKRYSIEDMANWDEIGGDPRNAPTERGITGYCWPLLQRTFSVRRLVRVTIRPKRRLLRLPKK